MRPRKARPLTLGAALVCGLMLASGCNLLSGLSELSIDETSGSGGSGGSGGTATSGGSGGTTTGSAGSGGSGGTTTGSGGGHCGDGEVNGDETDIDCGGPTCMKGCAVEKDCSVSADCESGICLAGRCRGAVQVATGSAHACVVLDSGAIHCWGANARGQLGNGDLGLAMSPVPVAVVNIGAATRVATGGLPATPNDAHSCALMANGEVRCWGWNGKGQLGDGSTADAATPTTTSTGDLGQTSIEAGGAFTCAIQSDASVKCWGANDKGQLAKDGGDAADPAAAEGLAGSAALALGVRHGCAVLKFGKVSCWGNNTRLQIGNPIPSDLAKAFEVPGLTAAGPGAGGDFSCASGRMGGLQCWGDNTDSQLTSAVATAMTAQPTAVSLAGVAQVALGSNADPGDPSGGHACARLASGNVACWGDNSSGQLGRGTVTDKEPLAVEIAGLGGVAQVAAGTELSCAVLVNGGVRCWGRNDFGQLGKGVAGGTESKPVAVAWP